MKKNFALSILSIICALCCAIGLVACGQTSFDKTNKFVSVLDGVFASAGYTTGSQSSKKSVAFQVLAEGSNMDTDIGELYDALKDGSDTLILTDYDLNYLKCDTLYQGANLAGLFKSMALVLGDDVLANVYDLSKLMPGGLIKAADGEYYTLYCVIRSGNTVESALQIDFKEYSAGKFIFKLVQYDKLNGVSQLRFSYYDSESVAFVATLTGDIGIDFSTSDNNYDAFSVSECNMAIFNNEDYVKGKSHVAEHTKAIMDFAKNSLGYTNQTYKDLIAIKSGKSISNKEANEIYSVMAQNIYSNPYTDTKPQVTVRDEYTIPSDVTVVETASIPATRKLIVPAHVQKILDAPFKYPQYVEEIIFKDPDNGALVQIGNDDITDTLYPFNNSYYFMLSYTQVKNFVLPKTVKKIAGTMFITTDMEVLDLSAYHPDYELYEDRMRKEKYTVSLYTQYYNRTYGFFKELGSIEKLYANEDYIFEYSGRGDRFDPEYGIKDGGDEYSTYNKQEDKHYSYSPSVELYTMMETIFGNHSDETAIKFAEYRGFTKIDSFIGELILSGFNQDFDLDSDMFGKISITVDIDDFADIYDIVHDIANGNIDLNLLENGQPKTQLNLFFDQEVEGEQDMYMYVESVENDLVHISELAYGEVFYAPYSNFDDITVNGETLYFVGWSFREDASTVDVMRGEKVTNFFQNMYTVYLPTTQGIEYIDNGNGYTAYVNNINEDFIVVAKTYNSKTVNTLELGDYTCKKLITPGTIGTANGEVIVAIAKNQMESFRSISRISDEINYYHIERYMDELKSSSAVYVEDGLYYLKNYGLNRFMLFAADEDLTGTVYIQYDTCIMAVKFGSGVTNIVLTDGNSYRLQYIAYLEFDAVPSLSIPSSATRVDYIIGTVTTRFSIASNRDLVLYDLTGLNVDSIFVPVSVFDEQILREINYYFNSQTKLFLDCGYEDIANIDFYYITDNMYFYSAEQPNFDDYDVAGYNYWHYIYNPFAEFAIWERE